MMGPQGPTDSAAGPQPVVERGTFWGTIVFITLLTWFTLTENVAAGSPGDNLDFTKPSYNSTVPENSVGKTYVTAEEKMGIFVSDPSLVVRYRIVSGDAQKMFKAESKTVGDFCFLLLRTRTEEQVVLNREYQDFYTLGVRATITSSYKRSVKLKAHTEVLVTVLDTNDLTPLFYPVDYRVSVPEDYPLHKAIVHVTATDPDLGVNGEVYYSLAEPSLQFAVHPTAGFLSPTRPLNQISGGQPRVHLLTVLAEDRGPKFRAAAAASRTTSTATVQVQVTPVNLYSPEIQVRQLPAILERSDPPELYAIVRVTDRDKGPHGQIKGLEIVGGDNDGLFGVSEGESKGEFKIQVKGDLVPGDYALTLMATDRGTPPRSSTKVVHVKVSESARPTPKFAQSDYDVEVEEVAPIGFRVVRLHTTLPGKSATVDSDRVLYSVESGNDDGAFIVNPRTGLLTTAKRLDRERRASYSLTVSAVERGGSGHSGRRSSTIGHQRKGIAIVNIQVIDDNDNDPVFNATSLTVTFDENRTAGSLVHRVYATDADKDDNGYVTYNLANLDPVPFTVDHFSGEIRTTQVLDYETMRREYFLVIRASDWGSPYRRQAETTVRVRVHDVNDHRPLFEKVDCLVQVSEAAPLGTEVLTLSALDFDAGNMVQYLAVPSNDDPCFRLDTTKGVLRTTCDLRRDRPTASLHERVLNVSATDGQHFADVTSVRVRVISGSSFASRSSHYFTTDCKEAGVAEKLAEQIRLANSRNRPTVRNVSRDSTVDTTKRYHTENKHAPEFPKTIPAEVWINESAPAGTEVVVARARDRDHGYSGLLVYVIEGNGDDPFRVDLYTGRILVDDPSALDRERTSIYTLNVTVFDLGRPQRSTTFSLSVRLRDLNDNPPRFERESYYFSIPESVRPGFSVLRIAATDPDEGQNALVRYGLEGPALDTFRVDPESGLLTVAGPLDRETTASYDLRVWAKDSPDKQPTLTSWTTVHLRLEDINDNAPAFGLSQFWVKVREDSPIGSVVMVMSARDPDTDDGGFVSYEGSGSDAFAVDSISGVVRVASSLDFETKQLYNVTVKSSDRGNPPLSSVAFLLVEVEDVNENFHAPKFDDVVASGTIKENEPEGAFVLKVSATDADPPGLDSTVHYAISGEALGLFSIDDQGNIRTTVVLDRERSVRHWLTVVAQDRGAVPLTSRLDVYVEVANENDNVPLTLEPAYHPSVPENSPPGTSVAKLEAFDLDVVDTQDQQKITFHITAGDPQGFFNIHESNGLITTTSRLLDREAQDEHVLEVTVSDDGQPNALSSTTRVVVTVVDLNDHEPVFLKRLQRCYAAEIHKSGPTNCQVLASDKDSGPNGDITYSLEGANARLFRIHPKTGFLHSQEPLRRGQQFELTVTASDAGKPSLSSSALVILEVVTLPKPEGNRAPVILLQQHHQTLHSLDSTTGPIVISESDPVGHLVALVHAEDPDGDRIWYSISGGNTGDAFLVQSDGGAVLVARALEWDAHSDFDLTVSATDGLFTVSTHLHIRVMSANKFSPEFLEHTYKVEISENSPTETEILRLEAVDRDRDHRLTYTIHNSASPDSLSRFRLDSQTGSLTIAASLDHETAARHILTVAVTDSGTPSRRSFTRLEINVHDHNDHAPAFFLSPSSSTSGSGTKMAEGRVYETAAIGTKVLQVTAVDRDRGINAQLSYAIVSGNVGSAFSIDSSLGILRVAHPLDRRSMSEFFLIIRATDGGQPPLNGSVTAHIVVTVADNAPPRFEMPDGQYVAELFENGRAGARVSVVSATSRSSVYYEIVDGHNNDSFAVNPTSGVLRTTRPLDYESQKFYNLTVKATNMVGSSALTNVLVHVLDRNDNRPSFLQKEVYGVVSETADVDSIVLDSRSNPLVVAATDPDSELNAVLRYSIVDKEARLYFKVDPSTGAISIAQTLDHEKFSNYTFRVQVTDTGRPRLSALVPAIVYVTVIDVNDSPPQFERASYSAVLLLPTYDEVSVAQVKATDPDEAGGRTLKYNLVSGNEGDKFAINEDTGLIFVRNHEDLKEEYQLVVSASDSEFEASAKVAIKVKDPPLETSFRFSQDKYKATVVENATGVTTVAVVTPVGLPLNQHIQFRILNPSDMFQIGTTSGAVRTVNDRPFDRESRSSHVLVVEAQRKIPDSRSDDIATEKAHVLVEVTVLDVNDNAPIFVNLPYYSVVPTEAEKGYVVRKVHAIDLDVGENGRVHYELVEGDNRTFEVDLESGEIVLLRPIAHTLKLDYSLIIEAIDAGAVPLRSRVEVPIRLINKDMPVFPKPYYNVSVAEALPAKSAVITVLADSPEGRQLIYSLVDGNDNEDFGVDFTTEPGHRNGPCILYVVEGLDFERAQRYELTLRATDSVSGAFADVRVRVDVRDVNDNAPEFEKAAYKGSVSEVAPFGTSVLRVRATDRDSGPHRRIQYYVIGNATSHFHVESSEGIVFVKQPLDREREAVHRFLVLATDGGSPPLSATTSVTVDVLDMNDNAPRFEDHGSSAQRQCSVSEGAPRGHFVTRVVASDPDVSDGNRLSYALVEGNEQQVFAIDPSTGIVTLSNLHQFGNQSVYSLNVSVTDGVYSSYSRLRIDVSGENAHSPQFTRTVYEVTVAENKAPGSPIATIKARDVDRGDYGKITYSVESPLHAKLFFVDPETGVLFTSVSFDRERQALYEVPVAAFDGGGRLGYATVRVTITNENDNAPEFPVAEYRAYVHENTSVGTTVLQVEATDADEETNSLSVEYSIYASNTSSIGELFGVSKDRGEIYLKRSLLKFGHQAFQFFVRARDKDSPSQESEVPINVIVVPPDLAVPKFERPSYEVFVSEKALIGTIVSALNVTSSPSQNEHLRFAFLSPPPDSQFEFYQSMFSISEQGKIVLNSALDRESASMFRLAVKAESLVGGVPRAMSVCALTIRVLDENDNHPIFETDQYLLNVAENVEKGSSLLKVVAHDLDLGTSGEVRYTFGPGFANAANVFRLDPKTGWITTLTALDYERISSYNFSVVATDNGQPSLSSTATVMIKVRDYNDNPSEFERRRYDAAIYEDAAPGTDILALEVRDRDFETTKVDFYITSGNPFEQFQVRQTGDIYVKRNLDRETVSSYLLEVTCTDGLHVSRTQVAIDVLDANDNPPTCLRSHYNEWISETVPVNTYVVTIESTDADDGRNALKLCSLTGSGSDDFIIDSSTGVVKTAKTLDRETQARYFLIARIRDRGRPEWECSSRLEIALDDVNDNPPKFTESTFAVAVPEDVPIGSLLTKVHALDPDLGMSRRISYSLTESANGIFAIDPRTGVVRLQGALDRESRPAYNLSVQAQDHGDPPLASVASIAVTVLDVNDNPPEFENQVTGVSVSEDASPGTVLVTLRATSRDVGDNALISYAIVAGDDREVFRIHSDTGVLEVKKALDYERVREYLLTIEARDAGLPPLSSKAVVNVSLSDANDNSPVFNRQSYAAVVAEDAAPGIQLLQVMASDADSGMNGQLSYSIHNGDSLGQFRVDPNTGIVEVASSIDREMIPSYILHVRCVDDGSPPLSSTALLHVTVSDVNDNAPLFSQTNYTAVVQEGKAASHPVLSFSILDADEPPNGGPFRLSLVSGDDEGRFRISQQDATLRTRAVLQARDHDRYMLRVRVTDNGSPPLSSEVLVDVTVAEESRYPPRLRPLEVTVNSYRDDFPGGVLGRVQATDDDPYDDIRFAIVTPPDQRQQQLFTIDREDGTILALPGLDVGSYAINISATDGKFTSYGLVSLEVLLVTEDALRSAVGIRLKGLSPEAFLLKHRRDFLHGLRTALDVSPKNLDLLSVQPALPQSESLTESLPPSDSRKMSKRAIPHNQNLDVLFAVRKAPNVYYPAEMIAARLKEKQPVFESASGLKVLKITKDRCVSNRCSSHGKCVDRILFDEAFVVSIATGNLAYVSPQHLRKIECVCQPGYGGLTCESIVNECARKPCSSQHLCFPDTSNLGYVCHCPPGKSGPSCDQTKNPASSTCPLHRGDGCYQEKSPVSYNGQSYARYSLVTSVERRLSVSLHLRTVQLTGNLMYLAGIRDYSILEVVGGYAQFRFDCGSGEGLVRASSRNIADGHWHSVRLDRRGNAAELIVDEGVDSASGRAPGPHDVLNLDGRDLFFGAEVRQQPTAHSSLPLASVQTPNEDIRMGFIGCMDDVKLDGVPLPLQTAPDARGTGIVALRRFVNVEFQCSVLFDPGPCGSQPCANGGSCRTSNSVSFTCRCPERFLGARCETDTNPCASSPCLNAGTCHNVNSTFLCECPRGLTGARCDYGRYCNPNPCHHGGACEEGTYGALCKCRGFYGDLCQWDVDECQAEPCGRGSRCLNVEGSFHCQCPPNATGILCNEPLHRNSITSTRWNTTVEEIVGIAVLVVFIMLLAGALACCWRIRHKQRRQRRPGLQLVDDPAANEFMLKNPILLDDTKRLSKMSNIEATFATPPLPPRPASYTPSTQESLSTALAKFDTVRDYGSAAQDLNTQKTVSLPPTIQQRSNQMVYCNDLDGGNSKNSMTDSETLLISNNKSTPWEAQEQLLLNNSSPPSCDEKVFEDKIRNDLNPSAMHPPSLMKKTKCQKSSGVSSVPSLSSVDDLAGYQWDISDWATASSDNMGSSFVIMDPGVSPSHPGSPNRDQQQDSSSIQSTDSNSFISQIEVIPAHPKSSPGDTEEVNFVPPPPQWSNRDDDEDEDRRVSISPSGEVRTYGFPTQGGLGFRVALEQGDYGDPPSPNNLVSEEEVTTDGVQSGSVRHLSSIKPSYV